MRVLSASNKAATTTIAGTAVSTSACDPGGSSTPSDVVVGSDSVTSAGEGRHSNTTASVAAAAAAVVPSDNSLPAKPETGDPQAADATATKGVPANGVKVGTTPAEEVTPTTGAAALDDKGARTPAGAPAGSVTPPENTPPAAGGVTKVTPSRSVSSPDSNAPAGALSSPSSPPATGSSSNETVAGVSPPDTAPALSAAAAAPGATLSRSAPTPRLLLYHYHRGHGHGHGRQPLLTRPSLMVLTKASGTRHVHHANPDLDADGEALVRRRRRKVARTRKDAGSSTPAVFDGFGDGDGDGDDDDDGVHDGGVGCCVEGAQEEDRGYYVTSDSDSDDMYDTDLDCPATESDSFQDENGDDGLEPEEVSLKAYQKACRAQTVCPRALISRSFGNRDLDLRHANTGSKILKPLFAVMKDNTRIQRLLLDEVTLDEDGAESLANALRDNVTVSHLSLAGNPLGSQGLGHVVRLLMANETIRSVDLSGTKLGADCILMLSHLLKENVTLRILDLSRNALEGGQMRFLAAAIGENRGLDVLRLSWNLIRQNAASAIGQSITVNCTLRILDLSWNGLGYEGAVAIAASLKRNDTLQELDVSHNRINWRGAPLLSAALAKNSSLKILKMGGNPLTTSGALGLVEAVSSPLSQLTLLDISNVPVVLETAMLATSIGHSRDFRLIHGGVVFSHDPLGYRHARAIKPMERLMEHMKEKMIRPLELLREFDKQGNGYLSEREFTSRLKKANIPLHDFETRSLVASVSDALVDGSKGIITYRQLITKVEDFNLKDRARKVKDQRHKRRTRDYHSRILNENKPLDLHRALSQASLTLDTPPNGGVAGAGGVDQVGGTIVPPPPPPSLRSLSVTSNLGKAKEAKKSMYTSPASTRDGDSIIRHLLVSSLLGNSGGEKKPLPRSGRAQQRVFTMSAPLGEIGRKKTSIKASRPKKKKTTTSKKKQKEALNARETTTLVGSL